MVWISPAPGKQHSHLCEKKRLPGPALPTKRKKKKKEKRVLAYLRGGKRRRDKAVIVLQTPRRKGRTSTISARKVCPQHGPFLLRRGRGGKESTVSMSNNGKGLKSFPSRRMRKKKKRGECTTTLFHQKRKKAGRPPPMNPAQKIEKKEGMPVYISRGGGDRLICKPCPHVRASGGERKRGENPGDGQRKRACPPRRF